MPRNRIDLRIKVDLYRSSSQQAPPAPGGLEAAEIGDGKRRCGA